MEEEKSLKFGEAPFPRRRKMKEKSLKLSKAYKAKTLEEAKALCPKGYRLPEIWELVKLACERNKKIFNVEKGLWIFFWSSTIYKVSVHRLGRDYDGDWYAVWGDLAYSYADGRVVFVK